MSAVPAKKTYGFTWTRFGHPPHTSSLSSMMATMESPQGNTDLLCACMCMCVNITDCDACICIVHV